MRIREAIANGSFQLGTSAQRDNNVLMAGLETEQVKRLDRSLVAQALHKPTPGLSFDGEMAVTSFVEPQISDLVQALEAFQVFLAQNGELVSSGNATLILKRFTCAVLSAAREALSQPEGSGFPVGSDEFWSFVAMKYNGMRRAWWQTLRVEVLLRPVRSANLPTWWREEASSEARIKTVCGALNAPSGNLAIDEAVAKMKLETTPVFKAEPYTLRSVVGHFETARSRYLSNLNAPHGPLQANKEESHNTIPLCGVPPQNLDQDHSSEDEDNRTVSAFPIRDIEENVQVEHRELRGWDKELIKELDMWMELSNTQQHGSVDVDMFSSLSLGDTK
ncbi:hypothetical protein diail_8675 [Diaporthe ilicicola]|nr:hypothetical protein diail_8675 [Diaporthe ilicicola]